METHNGCISSSRHSTGSLANTTTALDAHGACPDGDIFFLASLYQYQKIYKDIKKEPISIMEELGSLEKDLFKDKSKSEDYIRWRSMLALELSIMNRRYQQINSSLLLRTASYRGRARPSQQID